LLIDFLGRFITGLFWAIFGFSTNVTFTLVCVQTIFSWELPGIIRTIVLKSAAGRFDLLQPSEKLSLFAAGLKILAVALREAP
jgi:hypothetical protein